MQHTYNITNDTSILNDVYGITPQINQHIQKAYKMALSGNASQVKKLQDYVEEYPHIPHFKNYLSVIYEKRDQLDEAFKIIDLTIQEHPNYLFGKLNYADKLMAEGEFEKVLEILGDQMDLQTLYPQRDIFHISEVTSFYQLKARYCMKCNDLDGLEECGEFLDEVAPDSEAAEMVGRMYTMASMNIALQSREEEAENAMMVEFESEAEKSANVKDPVFTHPEVKALYENNMRIDKEILHYILALPRTSIVKDLELVLEDSIERYNHFNVLLEEEGLNVDFLLHAILLLGELGAVESFPVLLRILSQHDEYYELYFGDYLSEGLWEPVYKIANTKLDELKEYMLEPDKYTFAKSMLFSMVEQIVAHQPERKDEVKQWYQDLCNEFAKCSVDDNVLDSELLGLMIWSYVDLVAKEAGPFIKPLFKKGWVSEDVCGSYDEIMSEERDIRIDKQEILSIDERYDNILNSWIGYREEEEYEKEFPDQSNWWSEEINQPVVNENKVGRNDPCPCGSGKKYKKCCWGK